MKTHLDLCSGIGGFALAAQWAGYQTIGVCEVDPWCRRVLAKRWPAVPQHDDVTTLDGGTVRRWIQQGSPANAEGTRLEEHGRRGGTAPGLAGPERGDCTRL